MWNLSPSYDRGRFSARLGATYNSASIYQYQWEQCTAAGAAGGGCEDPAALGPKGPLGDNYLFAHLQVDAQASVRASVSRGLTARHGRPNMWADAFVPGPGMIRGIAEASPRVIPECCAHEPLDRRQRVCPRSFCTYQLRVQNSPRQLWQVLGFLQRSPSPKE
jgi:hypothetical protein